MDCSCAAIDLMDADNAWGMRTRKARKTHTCCECREKISPGEYYQFHTVFYEGSISNHKVCKDCQSVIDQFFPYGWWFEMVWDNLYDYFDSSWREDLPSSCIIKLTPKARDKVCDILQELHEKAA